MWPYFTIPVQYVDTPNIYNLIQTLLPTLTHPHFSMCYSFGLARSFPTQLLELLVPRSDSNAFLFGKVLIYFSHALPRRWNTFPFRQHVHSNCFCLTLSDSWAPWRKGSPQHWSHCLTHEWVSLYWGELFKLSSKAEFSPNIKLLQKSPPRYTIFYYKFETAIMFIYSLTEDSVL